MMIVTLLAIVSAVSACKTDADCKSYNMSLPHCVEQATGDYTQCIDCEPVAFQDVCKDWTSDLLKPAEKTCGLTCKGPTPPTPKLACHEDKDCKDPSLPSCVVQADGQYAQCISCNATEFENECQYWDKHEFLPAAEKKCGHTCSKVPPKLACRTDQDCRQDPRHPTCVVQADKEYAQCITCDNKQFHLDCVDWDKTKFLPAAEARCKESCFELVEAI